MPCDYDRIRRDNLDEYGKGIGRFGKSFFENFYSERTHFLMELIQNAEDKKATWMRVRLWEDRVEVSHDGDAFTCEDVKRICGIAESKKSELTDIGRFGIGFKSVFSYTNTPVIHSGDEHFSIKDFVYPHSAESIQLAPKETRIVLPFDQERHQPGKARTEILEGLRSLHPQTLLFLRNMQRVVWSDETIGSEGSHERNIEILDAEGQSAPTPSPTLERRTITMTSSGRAPETEAWFVTMRRLDLTGPNGPPRHLECAFKVAKTSQGEHIRGVRGAAVAAFFPTKLESHLAFLVQAPFRTTSTREGIPHEDQHNRQCVDRLADLAAVSLQVLKGRGLLTPEAFREVMPATEGESAAGRLLAPIGEKMRAALFREELIPTVDGAHVRSANAVMVDTDALRKLLAPEVAEKLLDTGRRIIHPDCYGGRDETLRKIIRKLPGTIWLDDDEFIKRCTKQFLEAQADSWIADLYTYWQGRYRLVSHQPNFRNGAWIRLTDGSHIPASTKTTPAAWFGTDVELLGKRVVRQAVAEPNEAREFLKSLGVQEFAPDTEVIHSILPRFDGRRNLDDARYQAELAMIRQAWEKCPAGRREDLRDALKGAAWVKCQRADGGHRSFKRPSDCYLPREETRLFFSGNPDAWLVGDDVISQTQTLLDDLKVSTEPRVTRKRPNRSGHVAVRDWHGDHKRGLNAFDPEFNIDGLQYAVRNPNFERSRYVWNLLSDHAVSIAGEVEESTRQNYENATRREAVSPAGTIARSAAWIANSGAPPFLKPSAAVMNQLPEGFRRDKQLAGALEMELGLEESAVAKEYGVEEDVMAFIRDNPQMANDVLRRAMREQAAGSVSPDEEASTVEVAAGLRDRFSRPGPGQANSEPPDLEPLGNPSHRATKVREEIREAIADEPPPGSRSRRVPRKVWEAADNQSRAFLFQEYAGRCQACQFVFTKRDGKPYFEGVYLLSRMNARWIDRPGNILCLCANCAAMFQHGDVMAEPDIVQQIQTSQPGTPTLGISATICGELRRLRFSDRHIVELKELLKGESREGLMITTDTEVDY